MFLVPEGALGSPPVTQRGTVTAIANPGLLTVRLGDGTRELVQVLGLTAPAAGSCALGQAAADATSLALGKPVWLVAVQGGSSKNVRRAVVAYVILPGGLDLGLELIKRGDATVRADQRPFKQRAAYLRAENAAQASSLGLWGCGGGQTTTTSVPPGRGQGQGAPPGQGQGHGSSGNGQKGPNK
jgi:endonuclease YncB( thermonuclease family)